MTAISGSYINNTTTKVMRVGDKLYAPIVLPTGAQSQVPAVAKPHLAINPLNMTLSESAHLLQEQQQKQQVNLEENGEPFVIEADGRLALVCSPYSPMAENISVTLQPSHDDHPKALCRDPSFHAVLPSSAISQSVAMFDLRLFEGISFNGSFLCASQPSNTHAASFNKTPPQSSMDMAWELFLPFKEDASLSEEVQDQESEFSVMSSEEEIPTPVRRKSNVGNILKKSRKNYDAYQTNILMDWYLTNNGKTPTSQGKLELAKATKLNVVQVATWFQNRKRRYLDTLNEYQTLSKKYPLVICDYQSYKSYIAAEKSSLKKKTRK